MTPLLLSLIAAGLGGVVGFVAGCAWSSAEADAVRVRSEELVRSAALRVDESVQWADEMDAELRRVRALLQAAEEDLAEANRREMDAELRDLGAAFVEEFAGGAPTPEAEPDTVEHKIELQDLAPYRDEIVQAFPRGWATSEQTLRRGMACVSVGMELMAVAGATLGTMEDWGEGSVERALTVRDELEARMDRGEHVPGVRRDVEAEAGAAEDADESVDEAWAEAEAAWAPRAKRRA